MVAAQKTELRRRGHSHKAELLMIRLGLLVVRQQNSKAGACLSSSGSWEAAVKWMWAHMMTMNRQAGQDHHMDDSTRIFN